MHEPKSLFIDSPVRSSVSSMVSFARRARRVAAAVAVAGLLPLSEGSAQSSTPVGNILDFNPTNSPLGKAILSERVLAWAAREDISLVTALERAIIRALDFQTGNLSTQSLQPPGNPNASGSGTNVSRDGGAAVGFQDSGFFTRFHAFRWTQATGPVDLGTLDPANNANLSSFAMDVTDGGSVVVGVSEVGAQGHAFQWTSGSGMVDLGSPVGPDGFSRALGVSGNGEVIVGDAEFPGGFSGFHTGAFRWTGGTFQDLGSLEPDFPSVATAVSADGAVVVGQGGVSVRVGNTQTNGSRAFRWTQSQGLQPIGPLPGDQFAAATGVSDNGKIVVGISSLGPVDRQNIGFRGTGGAFRWTEATGIRDLRQLLVDVGVDLNGITLVSITGISPDGQFIVGLATTPQTGPNETAGFIVQYCDDAIGGPCTDTSSGGGGNVVCRGVPATIVGTDGPDSLTGTPGRDVIAGLAGNDRINGGGGNDLICGDAGNDTLSGGAGNDSLFGGAGRDRLKGGAGRDRLDGGGGKDKLSGGSGPDTCKGGPGSDTASACERASGVP